MFDTDDGATLNFWVNIFNLMIDFKKGRRKKGSFKNGLLPGNGKLFKCQWSHTWVVLDFLVGADGPPPALVVEEEEVLDPVALEPAFDPPPPRWPSPPVGSRDTPSWKELAVSPILLGV